MSDFGSSLYSKAAKIAREQPQGKGTVDQMLGMMAKRGVKPAELENAGRPFGDQISKEELARHFEKAKPEVQETRFGEYPTTTRTIYHNYKLPGGQNYREVLLHTPPKPDNREVKEIHRVYGAFPMDFGTEHEARTYLGQLQDLAAHPEDQALHAQLERYPPSYRKEIDDNGPNPEDYQSGHWDTPNVLAHLRYTDRTAFSPSSEASEAKKAYEEAKSKFIQDVAPLKSMKDKIYDEYANNNKSIGLANTVPRMIEINKKVSELAKEKLDAEKKYKKLLRGSPRQKLLHLEELQSDWGQEGRKKGFQEAFPPEPGQGQDLVPPGPYVQNTQHWVDLGLKHALHEAAKGGHDAISWNPGEVHSEMYGNDPDREEGLKGFYNNIVPKSLLKLARQHDPEAQLGSHQIEHPSEEIREIEDQPEGWKPGEQTTPVQSLQITPKMRDSVLKGQPVFRDGGAVDHNTGKFIREARADGGKVLSDAQKEAGNYKKDHVDFQGLPISIENRKGSVRSGKDANGKQWHVTMPYDYGYVKRTVGADGDAVDVCIGPEKHSNSVFIVDQKDARNGKFDEHKVMLGYPSLHAAQEAYKSGFSDGKGHLRMGPVVRMTVEEFKKWLKTPKTKTPNKTQELVDSALKIARHAAKR